MQSSSAARRSTDLKGREAVFVVEKNAGIGQFNSLHDAAIFKPCPLAGLPASSSIRLGPPA
jgi:hypothetical protein